MIDYFVAILFKNTRSTHWAPYFLFLASHFILGATIFPSTSFLFYLSSSRNSHPSIASIYRVCACVSKDIYWLILLSAILNCIFHWVLFWHLRG